MDGRGCDEAPLDGGTLDPLAAGVRAAMSSANRTYAVHGYHLLSVSRSIDRRSFVVIDSSSSTSSSSERPV